MQSRIKFPQIKNIESTFYNEAEISRIEQWQQSHKVRKPLQQLNVNCTLSQSIQQKHMHSRALKRRNSVFNEDELRRNEDVLNNVQQVFDKIKSIDYKALCINPEDCARKYQKEFDVIERMIGFTLAELQIRMDILLNELAQMRQYHINKLEKQASRYTRQEMGQRSLEILEKENQCKRMRRRMKNIDKAAKKYYEFSLKFGLNCKSSGLCWILPKLDHTPEQSEFPDFLSLSEKLFLLEKAKCISRREELNHQKIEVNSELAEELASVRSAISNRIDNFREINDTTIKSNRLQEKIQSETKHVGYNRSKMEAIVNKSCRIKATSNQVIYEVAKQKCIRYFSNSNILKDNLKISLHNRSEISKRQLIVNKSQQIDKVIAKLIDRQAALDKAQADKLKNEFENSTDRVPLLVFSSLFGWEPAKRIIRASNVLTKVMDCYVLS